jgi:hypothetical protein
MNSARTPLSTSQPIVILPGERFHFLSSADSRCALVFDRQDPLDSRQGEADRVIPRGALDEQRRLAGVERIGFHHRGNDSDHSRRRGLYPRCCLRGGGKCLDVAHVVGCHAIKPYVCSGVPLNIAAVAVVLCWNRMKGPFSSETYTSYERMPDPPVLSWPDQLTVKRVDASTAGSGATLLLGALESIDTRACLDGSTP